MWPTEETAARLYNWANLGLIFGLCFGVVSTVLVVWMGNVKESYSNEKIAATTERLTAAQEELARLQKDAADAEAAQKRVETDLETQKQRTAEAQKAAADAALELAKFRAPRVVPPEKEEAIIAALRPFAGQSFALAVFPDPEPLALIRSLDTLLKSAGWRRAPAQIQRDGGVLVEVSGETAASIFDSGVDAYIAPDDNESLGAQRAFCQSLVNVGIPCETHRTPQLVGKTPRAITISVGKKQ
ncbi:MAG: hypothetical protein WAL45_18510 [Terracidiphilus sp.]